MSGKQGKLAIDTNVAVYMLTGDHEKAKRAREVMQGRPTISVQVLNEITNVCVRKHRMSWSRTGQFLALMNALCDIAPLTVEIHDLGRRIAERHGFAFYDSCIVAAALREGCETLYTEDMHHGLVVDDQLTLINPFL
jgi:predicted nucleic acid-binding protein